MCVFDELHASMDTGMCTRACMHMEALRLTVRLFPGTHTSIPEARLKVRAHYSS